MKKSDIDVLIVTYNSKAFIGTCIDSLLGSEGMHIRITVIDNASTDGTAEQVEKRYPSVKVLKNLKNMGYACAVNKGVASVAGDFFIIANADVVFHRDTVCQMVEHLIIHRDVGVVGAQQVFPDGKWQRSYGNVPGIVDSVKNLIGITTLHNWVRRFAWPRRIDTYPKEVGYIDGAAMAIRKEAYEFVGGFDENFFFYGEEADFCFRLKKSGWRVVFLPSSLLTHIRGGSSRRADPSSEKYLQLHVNSKLLLFKKHYPQWQFHLYIQLEKIHAQKLALIYRLIGFLLPESKRGYVSNRVIEYNLLSKIWSKQLTR